MSVLNAPDYPKQLLKQAKDTLPKEIMGQLKVFINASKNMPSVLKLIEKDIAETKKYMEAQVKYQGDTKKLQQLEEEGKKYDAAQRKKYEAILKQLRKKRRTELYSGMFLGGNTPKNETAGDKLIEALQDLRENLTKTLSTTVQNTSDIVSKQVLGPFQLITKPLESLTGVNLGTVIGNGLSKLLGGKKGGKPSDSEILKSPFGRAIYWLFGKGQGKEQKKGILGRFQDKTMAMLKGAAGPAIQGLLKGGAIAAIIGGVIWMVADGIKGAKLASIWGTSKISAVIGAAIAGTGSGWQNAFKNMGKWALIGAGTGFLVGGPVGALAGGLIGAAVGGVLGFIGGEKIAKFMQKIGDFFSPEKRAERLQKRIERREARYEKRKLRRFEREIKRRERREARDLAIQTMIEKIKGFAKNIVMKVVDFITNLPERLKEIWGKGKEFIKNIGPSIKNFISGLFTKIADAFTKEGGMVSAVQKFIKGISHFFEGLVDTIKFVFQGGSLKAAFGQGTEAENKAKDKFMAKQQIDRIAQSLGYVDYSSATDKEAVRKAYKKEYDKPYAYAKGGIALRPQMATLAEKGNPEMILPMKKGGKGFDDKIVGNMFGGEKTEANTQKMIALLSQINDTIANKQFTGVQTSTKELFPFEGMRKSSAGEIL